MPLFSGLSGSAAQVFGVDIYGADDTLLKRVIIMPIFKVARRAHDLKWRLYHRFHPRHRYNIIRTGLEPGYYDADTLMLHGCFALLRRYVEVEMGGAAELQKFTDELNAYIDPYAPEEMQELQAVRQAQALELYHWWMTEYPRMKARRAELMDLLYSEPISFSEDIGNGLRQFVRRELSAEEMGYEKELSDIETRFEEDEQEMLRRLIGIRRSLWA